MGANIAELEKTGRPRKQAIAIAYDVAEEKTKRKPRKGKKHPDDNRTFRE